MRVFEKELRITDGLFVCSVNMIVFTYPVLGFITFYNAFCLSLVFFCSCPVIAQRKSTNIEAETRQLNLETASIKTTGTLDYLFQ